MNIHKSKIELSQHPFYKNRIFIKFEVTKEKGSENGDESRFDERQKVRIIKKYVKAYTKYLKGYNRPQKRLEQET